MMLQAKRDLHGDTVQRDVAIIPAPFLREPNSTVLICHLSRNARAKFHSLQREIEWTPA